MTPGIIIPLIALPVALIVAWRWYRHAVGTPSSEADDGMPGGASGIRLTAEALHRLPAPPWRVVHEIGERLPGIDHVVIGPPGVVAVASRVGDRPSIDAVADAGGQLVNARVALLRAPLDEVLGPVSLRTSVLANVYWGAAQPHRDAAETVADRAVNVEAQRLGEWLAALGAGQPPALDGPRVDAAWRIVAMGIGRPDPLA